MRTLRIPSASRPGVAYQVARGRDGEVRCSCPATGPCKHQRIFAVLQKMAAFCQLEQHDAGRGLCLECAAQLVVHMSRKVKREYVTKVLSRARVALARRRRRKVKR